jgi:dolichyl-phosphate-mannose--protein O-mannosyl transferase
MTIRLILLVLFVCINRSFSNEAVTCGSAVKLIHKESGTHLHSHAIAWGSGSGQQSVTATGSQNDASSLWLIKPAHGVPNQCSVGESIKCGDKIGLEHVSTGKNLHSHLFKAPLTGNQEVSGFGDNGQGDTGDNWTVVCDNASEKHWIRGQPVHFQHVDTGKLLYTTEQAKFNHQNCGGGCPIMGQTEVSCSARKDAKTKWQTGQGVFFPPKNEASRDEL